MVVELGDEVIRGWGRGTLLPRGRCAQDRPPSWLGGMRGLPCPLWEGRRGRFGCPRLPKLGARWLEDEAAATRAGPRHTQPPGAPAPEPLRAPAPPRPTPALPCRAPRPRPARF